jgi:hypothetical protein
MKTCHDPLSRAEAATCRWVPVRPTDGQLEQAAPALGHHSRQGVTGPHLRCVRKHSRSNIGVPGICKGLLHRHGHDEVVFYVQQGSVSRKVYTRRCGISEGFRHALQLRAKWEELIEAANRAILKAREIHGRAIA